MSAIRAVVRSLHHLPWIAAAVVLMVGLVSWSAGGPKAEPPAAAEESEATEPGISMEAFRQAMRFDELSENPLGDPAR